MTEKAAENRSNRRRPKPSKPNDAAAGDFRQRLGCAGQMVRDAFGLDHPDPALVNRDSYLIVVSRIIQAITDGAKELSTADLTSLSKALAEQRRLEISRMEVERRFPETVSSPDTLDADTPKPLPKGFGRMVEQIYGTNLDKPSNDGDGGG